MPILQDDWTELNEQWQQRSQWLFQRCVKEPDIAVAQLNWGAACRLEKKRLEWKRLCLGQEEQEELLRAFVTAEGE